MMGYMSIRSAQINAEIENLEKKVISHLAMMGFKF